ncbi:MAG: hypothetical protein FWG15_02930 [Propionibacteriaceae bacterium]|nr:hypothetical protein [Propionibacteriaceae bacterium]
MRASTPFDGIPFTINYNDQPVQAIILCHEPQRLTDPDEPTSLLGVPASVQVVVMPSGECVARAADPYEWVAVSIQPEDVKTRLDAHEEAS